VFFVIYTDPFHYFKKKEKCTHQFHPIMLGEIIKVLKIKNRVEVLKIEIEKKE
jgi:hypothetical protein